MSNTKNKSILRFLIFGSAVFLLSCNAVQMAGAPSLARQNNCDTNWSWHTSFSLMTGNTGSVAPIYKGPGRMPKVSTSFDNGVGHGSTLSGTSITAGTVSSSTRIKVIVSAADGCSGTTTIGLFPTMTLTVDKASALSSSTFTFSEFGGVPPLSYSVAGSISTAGTLSSTSSGATYTPGSGEINKVTVTVTDANSNTATASAYVLGSPAVRLEADSLNGEGVALPNDSDAVSTWTELANANNFTQGVAGKQPVFKTNVINSLPAVKFKGDGTLDNLQATDYLDVTDFTFFSVAQASAGAQVIFSDLGAGGVQNVAFGSGASNLNLSMKDSAGDTIGVSGGDTVTSFMLAGGVFMGSTQTIYKYYNGAQTSATNAAYDATTTFENVAGLPTLGSLYDSASRALNGYIATFLAYKTALSQEQMNVLTCFYSDKYAITSSLTCP